MNKVNTTFKLSVLASLCFFVLACTSKKFDEPMLLSGRYVSAGTLNLGHDIYMNYCMQCHGVNGDGKGPAAQGSQPPPRSFKEGIFKFVSTEAGELPTDEDLVKTIRYGLKGTPMLPWDLSDKQIDAVIQYIKSFSEVWKKKDFEYATRQEASQDPFGVKRASEAIALGKKVYHGIAQCYTCHPSYASLAEINEASLETAGSNVTEIRANAHLSTPLDSSYGHKFMPPDYTKDSIKTGGDVESLYQVLGTGVGGTAMPAWKGNLSSMSDLKDSERKQWALAYYVNWLHQMKFDFKARQAFIDELKQKRN